MIAPTSLKHEEGGAGGTAVQITTPRVDIAIGWTHKRVGTAKAHRHSQHRSRHPLTDNLQSDQQSRRQPPSGVTSLPAGQHEALFDLVLGGAHHLSHGRPAAVLHPQHLPGGSNHLLVFKYTLTSMTNEL